MPKTAIKQMDENAAQAAAFLGGLANPHRLRILCHLADGEKNVSQLIKKTGLAQTSMSQHLNKLKDEGIVSFRREHRTLYYFITNPATLEIMDVMYQHFCKKKGRKA